MTAKGNGNGRALRTVSPKKNDIMRSIYGLPISGDAKNVLHAMVWIHADDQGAEIWCSAASIANTCNIARETAARIIADARSRGWLVPMKVPGTDDDRFKGATGSVPVLAFAVDFTTRNPAREELPVRPRRPNRSNARSKSVSESVPTPRSCDQRSHLSCDESSHLSCDGSSHLQAEAVTQNGRSCDAQGGEAVTVTGRSCDSYAPPLILGRVPEESQEESQEESRSTASTDGADSDLVLTPPEPGPAKAAKKKSKTSAAQKIEWARPPGVTPEAWEAWLESRRGNKQPMTEFAYKCTLADLAKLVAEGFDPNDVVANAATKGWRGLYAPSKDGPRATASTAAPSNGAASPDDEFFFDPRATHTRQIEQSARNLRRVVGIKSDELLQHRERMPLFQEYAERLTMAAVTSGHWAPPGDDVIQRLRREFERVNGRGFLAPA